MHENSNGSGIKTDEGKNYQRMNFNWRKSYYLLLNLWIK